MRTTIYGAGRIVVPEPIRDRLRLGGGAVVDITERGGVSQIVPAPADVEVITTASGPVARPTGELPSLHDEDVLATIDQTRR